VARRLRVHRRRRRAHLRLLPLEHRAQRPPLLLERLALRARRVVQPPLHLRREALERLVPELLAPTQLLLIPRVLLL